LLLVARNLELNVILDNDSLRQLASIEGRINGDLRIIDIIDVSSGELGKLALGELAWNNWWLICKSEYPTQDPCRIVWGLLTRLHAK